MSGVMAASLLSLSCLEFSSSFSSVSKSGERSPQQSLIDNSENDEQSPHASMNLEIAELQLRLLSLSASKPAVT